MRMGTKKGRHTPSVGRDPKRLQGEKSDKKLVPLARKLIISAVLLVAVAQMLVNYIPRPVGDAMTLLGGILAVGALIFQLRGQNRKL